MDFKVIFENIGKFFYFIVLLVIIGVVVSNYATKMSTVPGATAASTAAVNKFDNKIVKYADYAILLVMVLSLFIIYFDPNNIVTKSNFVVILMFLLAIIVLPLLASIMANMYEKMISNASIAVIDARMPITHFMLSNYGIVAALYLSVALILYYVSREQQ